MDMNGSKNRRFANHRNSASLKTKSTASNGHVLTDSFGLIPRFDSP